MRAILLVMAIAAAFASAGCTSASGHPAAATGARASSATSNTPTAGSTPPSAPATSPQRTPSSTGPRLTPRRAHQIEQQVTSGERKTVLRALAIAPQQHLDPDFITELHALGRIHIQQGTLTYLAKGLATVNATTGPAGQNHWQLTLIRDHGSWKVLSTTATGTSQ